MHFLIDAAIAAILIINVVRASRKGLVKTLFGLASVIIAIILAYVFGSSAGSLIRTTGVYADICDSTRAGLAEYFENEIGQDSEAAFEEISSMAFVKQLESMGVDTQKELSEYAKSLEMGAEDAAEVLAEKLAIPAIEALSNILGTIIVFAGSLLIFSILSVVLSGVFSLPFLRSVNKIGGIILGLVLGVFYAFVLCMIVKSLIPCLPENPVIYQGMENDTLLYGFFSHINPLYLLLIGKFF